MTARKHITHEVMKNVPVPKTKQTRTSTRRKYNFEEMEVGDMFFVPGLKTNTMATYVSTTGRKLGMKFLTRMIWMVEGLEGWKACEEGAPGAVRGVGVWRKK